MSELKNVPADLSADEAQLEVLHERVNAMLETPLPQEGDAFPLPVEEAIAAQPAR